MLNAYARRLQEENTQTTSETAEGSGKKRRSIINKISVEVFDRIARTKMRRKSDTLSARPVESGFIYTLITQDGEKITKNLEIQDSDFLHQQMAKITRSATEK